MHTIRAYCTNCRAWQDVDTSDAVLLIPDTGKASLSFLCPCCGSQRVIPATADKVDALAAMGVPAERFSPVVPSRHADGPPLCLDDLLTLHEQLATL